MLEFAVRCSTYICDVKFSVWGRPLGVKKGLHAVLLTRPYGTVSCNVIPYLSIHPWSNPLVTCESLFVHGFVPGMQCSCHATPGLGEHTASQRCMCTCYTVVFGGGICQGLQVLCMWKVNVLELAVCVRSLAVALGEVQPAKSNGAANSHVAMFAILTLMSCQS